MGRLGLLRFLSGVGIGLLAGWMLGAWAVVPAGGWRERGLFVAGLALALLPAFLASRPAEPPAATDRGRM
jgi:hypothetical protein